jgi:hypothetical protein
VNRDGARLRLDDHAGHALQGNRQAMRGPHDQAPFVAPKQ